MADGANNFLIMFSSSPILLSLQVCLLAYFLWCVHVCGVLCGWGLLFFVMLEYRFFGYCMGCVVEPTDSGGCSVFMVV